MDFKDEVRARAARFEQRVEYLRREHPTEEATKTSLVLPFIQMLGYDIFDPTEVIPEFTADLGTKQGEKVDYALIQDGEPAILIECKRLDDNLSDAATSQLLRYFSVTTTHFGILTNGMTYRFFSDIDKPNIMDNKPFFEFDMSNFTDKSIEDLKRFTLDGFDIDKALQAATVLKYIDGMKAALERQLATPDDEFVRWLTKQVYSKQLTQTARGRFTNLVRQAFRELVDDRINQTLKSALARDTMEDPRPDNNIRSDDDGQSVMETVTPRIITTEDEAKGYELVKSLVSDIVQPERVFMRDTQSYCGVLLDNNNRLPIVRLRFNSSDDKYIEIAGDKLENGRRSMSKYPIATVDDIGTYTTQLRAVVRRYLGETSDVGSG